MHLNPYSPPTETTVRRLSRFVVRDRRVFLVAFAILFVAGLFVPTIEMFMGNISLGRQPVWLAYVGIFAPEYWGLAFPVIFGHITIVTLASWATAVAIQMARSPESQPLPRSSIQTDETVATRRAGP
ncbi:hypothetical protein FF011L_20050 [Roseimaritima multifibrata]|uniref:Uncharacterized protein n=1 Tax=Roseimaritima multifibrata TaxID=1930274 RepID=A0A517MED8_9BACT|nr:hypothetical protein [Roseimaritima multifibrata]QDS93243.1 hypothetical protein FF011L_20050 [Roseimaritima multifibrata]